MTGFVPPMLAVTGGEDDDLEEFAFEFKWDGIRAIARIDEGHLTLWSRRGNDITASYPELAGLVTAVPPGTVLDGEIVAFDEHSRPSFARLQRRMHVTDPVKAAQLGRT
ncbi:MAG: hypothetical protein R3320_15140, partial [Nitriliruptorales bacterium]|nr:hypothetical protein [Nitriliruptorales bacterium]